MPRFARCIGTLERTAKGVRTTFDDCVVSASACAVEVGETERLGPI
jgi:hypothetical protein